ncbi:MAG: single-stranded DNA-binding protein [Bdellovibrionales bacterium]|nr:single-stranded DNA-binding protein [Bdellovibrionales bacterium]
MGINRVFLSGRLGQDPQLKTTEQGQVFTLLKIATHRYFAGVNGSGEQKTDWHDVFVWGRQGETCHKYLSKGQSVSIEGFLKNYIPARESGEKFSKSVIQALQVDFLHPKPSEQNLTS